MTRLFVVYLKTLSVAKVIWCRIKGGKWIFNWKGCERKWFWPNLRYYPVIWVKRLRKTRINLARIACPGLRFESGIFRMRSRCANHSATTFGALWPAPIRNYSWNDETIYFLGVRRRGMQGVYLHWTAQHRKTKVNKHAFSGIRPHDFLIEAAKCHVLGHVHTS